MSGPLTSEIVCEAAEVPDGEVEINRIAFVAISSQRFTDVSILDEAVNLRIIIFRMCGFLMLPPEIMKLKGLESLDLSGNSITLLPEPNEWAAMTRLHTIVLNDNDLSLLPEVYKMVAAPGLRRISVMGNICMTVRGAFDKIMMEFPNLQVLNGSVITSQQRGLVDVEKPSDPDARLPDDSIDKYFYNYMKYMHCSGSDRYIRKTNVELFCLNRVIRRCSSVDIIQSVWRGYVQRTSWKVTKMAAIKIERAIRRWYRKRVIAAQKIRSCFLYYQLRRVIKLTVCARFVQCLWRQKIGNRETLTEVFATDGVFPFYLMPKDVEPIGQIMDRDGLKKPDSVRDTNFQILRENEAHRCSLPGAPVVYYGIDGSMLFRIRRDHDECDQKGLWCGHDHSMPYVKQKTTGHGVNWTHKCPFNSLKPELATFGGGTFNEPDYDCLIRYVYNDRKIFGKVISAIAKSGLPVRVFPERMVKEAAAQTTIQTAVKMFIVRSKMLEDMKQEVIEKRAKLSLRCCITTMRTLRLANRISKANSYFRSLPRDTAFYVSSVVMERIGTVRVRFPVKFGYSPDRAVTLDDSVTGFLPVVVPQGNMMFGINDLQSLTKMGTEISRARQSMFHRSIPQKALKKYHLMRVSFLRPEEIARRMLMYVWTTGRYMDFMTEDDVYRYCAACVIQSTWRGFAERRVLRHLSKETGLIVKSSTAERMAKGMKNGGTSDKEVVITMSPIRGETKDMISQLRRDYQPWASEVNAYKSAKAKERSPLSSPLRTPSTASQWNSPSARNLGMVCDIGKDLITVVPSPKVSPASSFRRYPGLGPLEDSRAATPFLTETMSQASAWTASGSTRTETTEGMETISEESLYGYSETASEVSLSTVSSLSEFKSEAMRSSQKSEVSEDSIQRAHAFTRIVRLQQIGIACERISREDSELEEKRLMTKKVREKSAMSRCSLIQKMDMFRYESVQRNRLEKTIITTESRSRDISGTKKRDRRIHALKEERTTRQQKMVRDRQFGLAFVSVSRSVSQQAEKVKAKEEKQRKVSDLRASVDEMRRGSREKKALVRERIAEIEHQKRRIIVIDSLIYKAKRRAQHRRRDELLEMQRDEKRKSPSRLQTKQGPNIPPAHDRASMLKKDALESAACELELHIGASLGDIESHALADILNDILNADV